MPLLVKNGKLLANGDGSLRGCCCDECSLVEVSIGISSYHAEPGSGGSGTHIIDSELITIGSAHARIGSSTMGELWNESDSEDCSPTPACGSERAYAICEYMSGKVKIPYKKASSEKQVAKGYFSSSKTNVGAVNNWAKWTLSISYYAQNGGAPTSNTKKPNVRVNIGGTDYSTNGTNRSWTDFKQTTAAPGGTMGRFDWAIYFT